MELLNRKRAEAGCESRILFGGGMKYWENLLVEEGFEGVVDFELGFGDVAEVVGEAAIDVAGVGAGAAEDEGVFAVVLCEEEVVSVSAEDGVEAGAAGDGVVSFAAEERVVSVVSVDDIVSDAGGEDVVARPAAHVAVGMVGDDDVIVAFIAVGENADFEITDVEVDGIIALAALEIDSGDSA